MLVVIILGIREKGFRLMTSTVHMCPLCGFFSPSVQLHISNYRLVHSKDLNLSVSCGIAWNYSGHSRHIIVMCIGSIEQHLALKLYGVAQMLMRHLTSTSQRRKWRFIARLAKIVLGSFWRLQDKPTRTEFNIQ